MTTQIQVRNDTAANWTSANPTLLSGEIGFETDTGRFKIGTGATAWASLPYGTANFASPPAIGGTTANTGRFSDITDTGLTSGRVTYATTGGNLTDSSNLTFNGTTLTAGGFSGPLNGTVGATTPATGAFTTVTATAGAGFQNVVVYTSGSSATWNLPDALKVAGAKFKVTVVGGGGQGGGTNATAGQVGGGGGAGGVAVKWLTYVAGQNSATYTVGAGGSGAGTNASGNNGSASTFIYNSVTYTGGLGVGGTLIAAGGAGGDGTNGDINITGQSGANGGTMAATSNYQGNGGNAGLGFGFGGQMPVTAAGNTGNAGVGYGSGGSGGRNGTGTTPRAGGAGKDGIIIIEY